MLENISPELFDWQCWRAGSPLDLDLVCRESVLIALRYRVRQYAVGWCDSERTICRPKEGHKAVMFFKDGVHFWFHLTNKEFEAIFNEA